MNKNLWWWVAGIVVVVGVFYGMYHKQPQASGSTVKIGVILPMTGIAANYGENQSNAIHLAVDEINARGGVLGKPLEVILEDDGTEPTKTVSAYQKVIDVDHVPVVIGAVWDFLANAVMPIVDSKKIPTISASAAPDSLTTKSDAFFTTFPPISVHQPIVEKYLNHAQGSRVAIMYINNAWGIAHRDMYRKAAASTGKQIVAEIELPNFDNNDIQSEVTRLKSVKPDILLTSVNLIDPKLIIEKNKDLGLNANIFGHDNIVASYQNKNIRKDALKDVVVYRLARSDSDFFDKYKKAYGATPISEADKAYDAVYVIAKAIELSQDTSSQGILRGLKQIKDYQGVSGPIDYTQNNWPTTDTSRLEIYNGTDFVSYLEQ